MLLRESYLAVWGSRPSQIISLKKKHQSSPTRSQHLHKRHSLYYHLPNVHYRVSVDKLNLERNHKALCPYHALPLAVVLCWQPASSSPNPLTPCGWTETIWWDSLDRSLRCWQKDLAQTVGAGDDVDDGGKAGEGETGHWAHGPSAGGQVRSFLHPPGHLHRPCLYGTWTSSGSGDGSACKSGTCDAKPSGSGAQGTGWSPRSSFLVGCHWPAWRLTGGAGGHAAPISLRHVLSASFQKTGLLWQPGTGWSWRRSPPDNDNRSIRRSTVHTI